MLSYVQTIAHSDNCTILPNKENTQHDTETKKKSFHNTVSYYACFLIKLLKSLFTIEENKSLSTSPLMWPFYVILISYLLQKPCQHQISFASFYLHTFNFPKVIYWIVNFIFRHHGGQILFLFTKYFLTTIQQIILLLFMYSFEDLFP